VYRLALYGVGCPPLVCFLEISALTRGSAPHSPAFSSPPGCKERCGKSSAIQADPPVTAAANGQGDAHRSSCPAGSRSAIHGACGNGRNDRKNPWRKRSPGLPNLSHSVLRFARLVFSNPYRLSQVESEDPHLSLSHLAIPWRNSRDRNGFHHAIPDDTPGS
jgi:hypothetical protein